MAVKRKPKPKLEDKEQSQRFIETARKLEVDESGTKFDKALGSLIPKKKSVKRCTSSNS